MEKAKKNVVNKINRKETDKKTKGASKKQDSKERIKKR